MIDELQGDELDGWIYRIDESEGGGAFVCVAAYDETGELAGYF